MASPTRSPPQQDVDDDLQTQQENHHQPPATPPEGPGDEDQPPPPPHSETLEIPDNHPTPNPITEPPLPLDDQENQNPQQSDEGEDTPLVLDQHDEQQQDDHQSGTTNQLELMTLAEDTDNLPPPPLNSPTYPHRRPNKRKKGGGRKQLKRKKSKKFLTLTNNLNPIPFKPSKKLDFHKHEEVLKRLGLWEFIKIEFDGSIKVDLVAQLIVNYDSRKRCSYVNDFRINVNRADMARALKLPAPKQDKGSSVEEVDLDSEVYSAEAIGFIEEFVSNWVLLHEDTWMITPELATWTRFIKDGHPEKMDCASLIWYMVEKELTQGEKLVNCYYASHLQYLIRSQREEVFLSEMEVEEVKEEDDRVGVDFVGDMEVVEEEENKSLVQEPIVELNLGHDVEKEVQKEVKIDEEMRVDSEELKVEEEQGSLLLGGKIGFGEHFLQRCQSSDPNGYEDVKHEAVEDEQVGQVEGDEEEEIEERGEDGFGREANDDSLERDGLTDNFLQGMETSHIPFSSQGELRGMSSVDLFGSRDGSYMGHGCQSFFSNGGKRVIEPEEDIHHHSLNGNSKRLKTDEMWDPKPTDFFMCMDQMQQWMEKAKMMYESKEQSYENSQYNQQMAISDLQERQNFMEMIMKSKDEELAKKHAEVFRLERELYLMGDLLEGYRKALHDCRYKFSEYRKLHALHEEPVYKDAGPGGLVLSTRELEKQRLKQEEEDRAKVLMLMKEHEEKCVCILKGHQNKVLMMDSKLISFRNELKQLKELSAYREKIQKSQSELEFSLQVEDVQKFQDEQELSPQLKEIQKSHGEQDLEQTQKYQGEQELSAQQGGEQKLSAQLEENQTSHDGLQERDASLQCPDATVAQGMEVGEE